MAKFGLPSIISQIPNDLRQFLDRVREFIDAATRGDSQLVSRSGLIEAGIAIPGPGNSLLPSAPPSSDTTPPPAPAGLVAAGTLTSIYLTWDDPGYSNHSYTKIWRALTDNFSNAVVIGSRAGAARIFADSVGMGASYYYWIQHVSNADVPGPVVGSGVGQAGVYGYTATDNTPMLNLLQNSLTAAHVQAGSITGDRIVAGGIIASHLSVADLSAVSANMGNLTAGTITLDQFGFIRSGNIAYASGVGFWMGYAGGAYKFYLGNPAGGYLDWNGSLLRIGGSAEFSGSLSGATGTFSGSLSAATGTFGGGVTGTGVIGTTQIQDSALTAPKIAAGSVIAGKIAANSISAAGGEIADLTVGTLKIQDNAVTIPVAAYNDIDTGSVGLGVGAETGDLISVTIASAGAPISIHLAYHGYAPQMLIRIYFNGALLWTSPAATLISDSVGGQCGFVLPLTWMFQHTPGIGSATYTMRVYNSYASIRNYRFYRRYIGLLETKK